MINLKKDGVVAWSYRWVTTKEFLPKSFCKVFWLTLLSWLTMIIFSPAFLLTLLFKDTRENPSKGGIVKTLMFTLAFGFLMIITKTLFFSSWNEIAILLTTVILSLAVCLVGLLIVFGVINICIWVYDKISIWVSDKLLSKPITKKYRYNSAPIMRNAITKFWWFIRLGIESFIGKYCPRINWK